MRIYTVLRSLAFCVSLSALASDSAFRFNIFNWLPSHDAELNKKISEFYGVDPSKHPKMSFQDGTLAIENSGGAPTATAAMKLRLAAGRWLLRFKMRAPLLASGQTVGAGASFLTERLDLRIGNEWQDFGAAIVVPGDVGEGHLTFSLRARNGRAEVKDIEIVESLLTSKVVIAESWSEATVLLKGKLVQSATLQWAIDGLGTWNAASAWRSKPLSSFQGEERVVLSLGNVTLPALFKWRVVDEFGATLDGGGVVRIGEVEPVEQGEVRRNVKVAPDGVIRIDGKPFFPLGVYTQKQASKDVVDEVKALGLNLALMFKSEHQAEAVAHARKNGLEVILATNVDPRSSHLEKAVEDGVRDIVALDVLATTAVDEPDLNPAFHPVLDFVYRHLRKTDSRPVYTSNHSPLSFVTMATQTDIIAVDPYPVSQNYQPLSTVAAWMDKAVNSLTPGRAAWYINQSFSISPIWHRAPTGDELRAMNWIAINHGAKGIVYYSLYDILAPGFPNHEWRLSASKLAEVVRSEARQIEKFADFLLTGEFEKIEASNGSLDVAIWKKGKQRLISVVNLSDNSQMGQFEVDGMPHVAILKPHEAQQLIVEVR